MKISDLGVVLAAATLTLAASWLCLVPQQIANASDPDTGLAVRQAPSLEHQGVVLRLQAERRTYQAGDRPELRLTAVNPSGAERQIPVRIRVASASPGSPLSRVVALPVQRWSQDLLVELAPGQSRTLRIRPAVALLPGQQTTYTLQLRAQPAASTQLAIAPEPKPDLLLGVRTPILSPKG